MSESSEYPYQRQWRSFRFWTFGWSVTIAVLLLSHLLLFYDTARNDLWIYGVLISWLLFIIANGRVMFWPCPKCGELFFSWWRQINLFFQYRCKNCGLERYDRSSYTRKA